MALRLGNTLIPSVTIKVDTGSSRFQAKTVNPTTTLQEIVADSGYDALSKVTINGVPAGVVQAPASVSGTGASISAGTNTLTLSKTIAFAPTVSTVGYVSSGTTSNSSVSLTANVTTKAASTFTPGMSDQTIAAGTYLTGEQTIKGDANLTASNIRSGVTIFGISGSYSGTSINNQSKTVTPTESQQSITADSGYTGLSTVTVKAITATYVGSGITTRNADSLSVSGAIVTVPAGYYASQATKSVASGTAGTPTATKGTVSNNSISITPSVSNTAGYIAGGSKTGTAITVTASELVSGNKTITANGSSIDVVNYATVNVNVPVGSTISNQDKTVSPTTSQQSITFDSGYTGLGTVTVNAMPTMSLPTATTASATSGFTSKATISRSTSDQYINIPTGYNSAGAYYKVSAVANGSAGTPTASKGTVSNNSISVTPSVTNTTGYITGGTKTGTAVTVSASELVSGNKAITANGTNIDVTNYATVSVSVSAAGPTLQAKTGIVPSESSQTISPDSGYDGLSSVQINAITATYVGSGIARKSSNDLTASGATVTVPAGYYASQATKSVSSMTLPTAATSSATSGFTSKATISRSTSDQYINIPVGYNSAGAYYKISAVANGTAGTPTATKGTVSNHSISVTPSVTNATGYITGSTLTGTAVTVSASELVSGNKAISANGTGIDVTNYATVSVSVPTGTTLNNQSKTVNPDDVAVIVTPDSGYTGLDQVTVNAIPGDYVGADIAQNNSTNLSVSGRTVTVPAGYYDTDATASIANGSATTPATTITANPTLSTTYTSGSGYKMSVSGSKSITPAVSAGYVSAGTAGTVTVSGSAYVAQSAITDNTTLPSGSSSSGTINFGSYIKIGAGYYPTDRYYKASDSAGSAAPAASISGTSATVTTGTNTVTFTKTISNTPQVTAGYITSGTAGDTSVSLTASITTKAAATITPGTSNQTIASGTYLTGTQTISGDADLVAGNIKSGVSIFGVTGTYSGASISNQDKTVTPTKSQQSITADSGYTGLGTVTVNAIPSQYITTTDADAVAANLLYNKTAYVNGSKITGTMANNGATGGTITTQNGTYTIPAGYTSGGTVTATLAAGSTTAANISGTAFEETTGDYGFRTSVQIQPGYYASATTITKDFSTILPAPDTEGTAAQVLIGYDLYNHEGELISGTMANNSVGTISLDQTTTSYTIPEGYHNGTGKVQHATVNIPDPTITVNSSGLITASGSWTRGFTTDNSYSNTYQLTTKTSSDLTVSGATVTAPAGYYASSASASVTSMTLPTSTSTSSSGTRKATIDRSTSVRYINIPVGYNSETAYYQISAVANGSAIGPTSLSGTSATLSTGTNTITLTKTGVSTTPTVSAGYVSSATSSTATVTLTASVTTKAAATYYATTSDQTIAASQYLTGTQTIKALSQTNLSAANIKSGTVVTVNNGNANVWSITGTYTSDATAIASDILEGETAYVDGRQVTGTLILQTYYTGSSAPSNSLGIDGDIYLRS